MKSADYRISEKNNIQNLFNTYLTQVNTIAKSTFEKIAFVQNECKSKHLRDLIYLVIKYYNEDIKIIINNSFILWLNSDGSSKSLLTILDPGNEEAINEEIKYINRLNDLVNSCIQKIEVSCEYDGNPTISTSYYNECIDILFQSQQIFNELYETVLSNFKTMSEDNVLYCVYGTLICGIISQFLSFFDGVASDFKQITEDIVSKLLKAKKNIDFVKVKFLKKFHKTACCGSVCQTNKTAKNSFPIISGKSNSSEGSRGNVANTSERNDSTYSIIRDFLHSNASKFRSPSRGTWSGAKGKSSFIISDSAVIKGPNGKKCSGKELKEWMKNCYGVSEVCYNDYDPDFNRFMNETIGEVDISDCPDGVDLRVYAKEKVAEKLGYSPKEFDDFLRNNELSIHETGNFKAIAIPTIINSVFLHTGGKAMKDYLTKIRKNYRDKYGNKKFTLIKIESSKMKFDLFGEIRKDDLWNVYNK